MHKNIFKLKGKVWLYDGVSPWHFITLPKKESNDIKSAFSFIKKSWGSIPVIITIGKTKWKTSIFPDKKSGAYLFPIKSEVRNKEGIKVENKVTYSIEIMIPAR